MKDTSEKTKPSLEVGNVPFEWSDPFLINNQLSEEERLIKNSAEDFALKELKPRVEKAYNDELVDKEIIKTMGRAGFLGCTIDENYGGNGSSYVSYGIIAREIERIDSGYRSMMSVQSSLVMYPIYKFGNEDQKRKYLPGLSSGETIGCFGLTEANSGSDPASMTTKAIKVKGGYELTGSKMWISNAPIADIFIIWAKSQHHENKIKGFILERGLNGLETNKIVGKLSLRASVTGEISLDQVFVSEDALLENVEGLKGPFSCLNMARYGISWGALGAAEFCWHAAREYGLSRKQFGRPLAATQLFQKKLADMQTEISIGLQSVLRLGQMIDSGQGSAETISLLKRNSCGKALEVARLARDMHGGNGISSEYGVMRHLQNLETVNTYEGTHDIHALILGKAQTGIQAFF